MNMTKEVDTQYSESEVAKLVQGVADEYRLDPADVNIDIDYEVGGSFVVLNADPANADIIEDAIRNSIGQKTGLPTSDILVNYNTTTGVVEYAVETDSYEDTNNIKDIFDTDSFTDEIEVILENIDSSIDIVSPFVDNSVVADLNIVVDAKVSMDDRTNNLSEEFAQDGFNIENAEGDNRFLIKKTTSILFQ